MLLFTSLGRSVYSLRHSGQRAQFFSICIVRLGNNIQIGGLLGNPDELLPVASCYGNRSGLISHLVCLFVFDGCYSIWVDSKKYQTITFRHSLFPMSHCCLASSNNIKEFRGLRGQLTFTWQIPVPSSLLLMGVTVTRNRTQQSISRHPSHAQVPTIDSCLCDYRVIKKWNKAALGIVKKNHTNEIRIY